MKKITTAILLHFILRFLQQYWKVTLLSFLLWIIFSVGLEPFNSPFFIFKLIFSKYYQSLLESMLSLLGAFILYELILMLLSSGGHIFLDGDFISRKLKKLVRENIKENAKNFIYFFWINKSFRKYKLFDFWYGSKDKSKVKILRTFDYLIMFIINFFVLYFIFKN